MGYISSPNPSGTVNHADGVVVNLDLRLPNDSTITALGFNCSARTVTLKICRKIDSSNFEIMTSDTYSHSGGWDDVTLPSPFIVPSTGDYYIGYYYLSPNNIPFVDNVTRASKFYGDLAVGTHSGFNSSTGTTGSVRAFIEENSLIFDETGPRIRLYNSGDNSERYTDLVISKYSVGIQRYSIISIKLEDLVAGEALDCEAHVEITTPHDTNIEVTGRLMYTDGAGDIAGLDINEENGTNVDIDQHHMIFRSTGNFLVPAAASEKWVNLVMYAAQDDVQNFDSLVVEQDYGRMTVTRYTP